MAWWWTRFPPYLSWSIFFKSEALYVGSMRTIEPGSMGIILLAVITTLTNKLLTIIKQLPTVGLLWIKKPFLIHYLIWGNGHLSHSCWHCEESMHSVPDQRRVFPSQLLGVSRKWIAQGIGLATPENAGGRGRDEREDQDMILLCEAVFFFPLEF